MTQELVFDPYLESRKNLAWWLYVFHGASLVFSMGLFSFIPLIISYVKRPETAGTFVYSHRLDLYFHHHRNPDRHSDSGCGLDLEGVSADQGHRRSRQQQADACMNQPATSAPSVPALYRR